MRPLEPDRSVPHLGELPTVDVLGIPLANIRLPELLNYIRSNVSGANTHGPPRLIAYANAHSCNMFVEDKAYRGALLQADLIYTDGNGPRLAAWLSGYWLAPRMTGADWVYDLCQLCERDGILLYFLGAAPGVAEAAAHRLRNQFPALRIVGVHHGFFPPDDEGRVLLAIQEAKPDVLVVGKGSPRQEIWMAHLKETLQTPLIWGAGGVFDYVSGRIPRPPRWMRMLALEWLGRMFYEPRRLALRYLVGLPVFLGRSLHHAGRVRLRRLRR